MSRAASSTVGMARLPRAVIPIYGTTFVDLLGYTLMIPLLPAVAERYGASDLTVGALLSVPALCSIVAAPMWGKMSDHLGRKTILLISQVFSLAGYLVLALAHSLVVMFAARVISGFGAGNMSAAQSYIADVTPQEQRDETFALYGVVFGAGFIVGPVASGLLMRYGVAIPFYVAAALALFNLAFTAAFLPQQPRARSTRLNLAQSLRNSIEAVQHPGIVRLFIRQFLFIFTVVYFLSSFALYVRHVLHYDVSIVSWLLALAGLTGGIVQAVFVAPMARWLGDRLAGQAGLAVLGVSYTLLLFVSNAAMYVVMLFLWAIGAALVEPTLMALLATRAPRDERGTIMGIGDSINSLALIFAPLAGSGIIGYDPRLLGALPLGAILIALWIGRSRIAGER